jgi:hypothetical protein
VTAATAPALAPDLEAGLRRLKLAAIRRQAAEVCQVAKTQRWPPEELLRTLVEAEIAARDASNLRGRLKQAGFPVTKTLDQFQVGLSSVPQQTFDYLASLEWLRARENPCLLGPAGTGKSHCENQNRAGGVTDRPETSDCDREKTSRVIARNPAFVVVASAPENSICRLPAGASPP